jgi:hypothetical protein
MVRPHLERQIGSGPCTRAACHQHDRRAYEVKMIASAFGSLSRSSVKRRRM